MGADDGFGQDCCGAGSKMYSLEAVGESVCFG